MELHTEGGNGVTYRGWEWSYSRGWEWSYIQRMGMELHTEGGNGVTYRGWEWSNIQRMGM